MFDASHTLCSYCERYLAARDVSPVYADRMRSRAAKLTEYAGGALTVGQLSEVLVDGYLASLQELGTLQPPTVHAYRLDILSLWNGAADDGLADYPRRVRRIKQPERIVRAWSLDEIRKLIVAAENLRGAIGETGIARRDWWPALICAAYDSALRVGDLLSIAREDVASDGTLSVVQSKTGRVHQVRFRPSTLERLARIRWIGPELLPWPARREALYRQFRGIVTTAGVRKGTLRFLRRSAASYAERSEVGAGSRLLGHRDPTLFARHYDCQEITSRPVVQPPEL